MSHTPVIDSIAFARSGSHCQGTMQGERLTRLDDSLVDRAGEVNYEVHGILWDEKPALELKIEGWLMVRCLRCLGPMRWPVQIENRIRLARDDADLDVADEEGVDAIQASQELNVAELVEDELLLQWPIAPRHDMHGMTPCDADLTFGGTEAVHPFAALEKLSPRRGGTKQGNQD
ncbi:MAG: YceD family protein [bacterium]